MQLPARHRLLCAAFVETQAEDPTPRFLEAFHFDDNEHECTKPTSVASANALGARLNEACQSFANDLSSCIGRR